MNLFQPESLFSKLQEFDKEVTSFFEHTQKELKNNQPESIDTFLDNMITKEY